MKNWDPFVFGPELAIDNIPAPEITNSTNENNSFECKIDFWWCKFHV